MSETSTPPSPEGTSTSPKPLDLINHIRKTNLNEMLNRLIELETTHPTRYRIVKRFLLSCKPDKRYGPRT
jgi:hypothetical protein